MYQEDCDTPFFPEMIKSKFNHIFAVVAKEKSTGYYTLKVCEDERGMAGKKRQKRGKKIEKKKYRKREILVYQAIISLLHLFFFLSQILILTLPIPCTAGVHQAQRARVRAAIAATAHLPRPQGTAPLPARQACVLHYPLSLSLCLSLSIYLSLPLYLSISLHFIVFRSFSPTHSFAVMNGEKAALSSSTTTFAGKKARTLESLIAAVHSRLVRFLGDACFVCVCACVLSVCVCV